MVALKLTPVLQAANTMFHSDYPNQPNQLRNRPTSRQHPGSHQPGFQTPDIVRLEVVNIELFDGITWSKIAPREEQRCWEARHP
jgi:hypothetical protein